MRASRALAGLLGLGLGAAPAVLALADAPDAGAPAGAGAAAGQVYSTCTEHLPDGAARPRMTEKFPARGLSGYAADLELTIVHGKGETVLPSGLKVESGSEQRKALEEAGFLLPDPDGGAGPTLTTRPDGALQTTTLVLPFLALPKKAGRNALILPPIPVAVRRASGEIVTVCTAPHHLLVEDPIANQLDPQVKRNPPPRQQREEWVFLEDLTKGILVGVVLAALVAFFARAWLRRPKVVEVPKPVLPWITAMAELEAIRRSDLLIEQKNDVYFDRVSDCVRKYLGARYGFDGLESTTDEMRAMLKRVRPPVPELRLIGDFLADCDLVKFARALPGEEDCKDSLKRGESIVRLTIPTAAPAPMAAAEAMR